MKYSKIIIISILCSAQAVGATRQQPPDDVPTKPPLLKYALPRARKTIAHNPPSDDYKQLMPPQPFAHRILDFVQSSRPFGWLHHVEQSLVAGLLRMANVAPSDIARIELGLSNFAPYNANSASLAAQETARLLQEARKKLGIPKNNVPLYTYDEPTSKIGGLYNARLNIIGYNLSNQNRPYGLRRHAIYHEAVHSKYHDGIGLYIPGAAVTLGSIFLLRSIPEKWPLKRLLPRSITGTLGACALVGIMVHNIYKPFMLKYGETRADTEAAYAMGCSHCIAEVADTTSESTKEGYLNKSQLMAIATKLAQDKLRCAYHINHSTDQ